MDVQLEAVGIAHGILTRRVLTKVARMVDHEELKQDLAAHVLGNLRYYRPERGSLKTFVGMTFDNWWRQSIKERGTRASHEESQWDMPDLQWHRPGGDQELSPKAEAIVARLPEHLRETVVYHVALGAPLTAAAEHTGAKYQTASTRARRARVALKEMAS